MPLTYSSFKGNGRKPRSIYPMLVIPLLAVMLIAGALTIYVNNFAHAAPAPTFVPLSGTLPPQLAHSKQVGSANTQQKIPLTITLQLRNAAALDSYIADVTRPKSANFHRYLTPAQAIGVFSPAQSTYDSVLAYLQHAGFTINQTYKHRLVVSFSGTIGQVERTFHVAINNYVAPDGTKFYSNANDPVLPSTLSWAVQSVSGLSNYTQLKHFSIFSGAVAAKKHTTKQTKATKNAPSLNCSPGNFHYYTAGQISAAYNVNSMYSQGNHGEGQTVALFELDTFQMSDITAYEACVSKGNTSIQTILVNGGPPPPGSGDKGIVEVEADAEMILGIAPKLGVLKIYEAANNMTDVLLQWSQIVNDAPPVVSTSWGDCEANITQADTQTENTLFKMAAAQGQTIIAASGDSGSSGCFGQTPSGNQLNTDDPASQPNVTAVGGTNMTMNGSNYGSETVWNASPPPPDQNIGASGGGISMRWQMPSWQIAPGVISSYSSGTPCNAAAGKFCREVPDVSLHAAPDWSPQNPGTWYLLYCTSVVGGCTSGSWYGIAGTSMGAPLWAAMMALTNEESVKNGGYNIGFLNPLLYQIASSANYSRDFNDITSAGNNDLENMQAGKYPTTTAYDIATGLGSYNAANLAADIVALGAQRTPTPASGTWYFAEGSVGGGFQEFLTLQNPSAASTATVSITYLLQNHTPSTITVQKTVSPSSRVTVNVNQDLGTSSKGAHISLAAIVTVTGGPNIVAERPMYFNSSTINSGTDVLGATHPGQNYYFSEADSTQKGSSPNYSTFVTMLNPSTTSTAHVTVTYYAGGCSTTCKTDVIALGPQQRWTVSPMGKGLFEKMAIAVNSDSNIVVERPMYFTDNIARAGGATTGAASEVGAIAPGNDWLFAEGYTGTNFQEYLELANFGGSTATASVKLEYTNGTFQTVQVPVPAYGQVPFDVNNANLNPNCGSSCQVTNSVSAEVTSNSPIVADRLMYFHAGSSRISGGTDVVGQPAPAKSIFAFAEGYTAGAYSEYLTLQNPTNNTETVSVTLFTGHGLVFEQQTTVLAHSRQTLSINGLLNPMGSDSVSMTVEAIGAGAVIVAERPMYFNAGGDTGGTDVIGYTG